MQFDRPVMAKFIKIVVLETNDSVAVSTAGLFFNYDPPVTGILTTLTADETVIWGASAAGVKVTFPPDAYDMPAECAFNGNEGDAYYTENPTGAVPVSLLIELTDIETLYNFKCFPRPFNGNGTIIKGYVLVSEDGDTYTRACAFDYSNYDFAVIDFDAVNAKFIKIVVLETNNNSCLSTAGLYFNYTA